MQVIKYEWIVELHSNMHTLVLYELCVPLFIVHCVHNITVFILKVVHKEGLRIKHNDLDEENVCSTIDLWKIIIILVALKLNTINQINKSETQKDYSIL